MEIHNIERHIRFHLKYKFLYSPWLPATLTNSNNLLCLAYFCCSILLYFSRWAFSQARSAFSLFRYVWRIIANSTTTILSINGLAQSSFGLWKCFRLFLWSYIGSAWCSYWSLCICCMQINWERFACICTFLLFCFNNWIWWIHSLSIQQVSNPSNERIRCTIRKLMWSMFLVIIRSIIYGSIDRERRKISSCELPNSGECFPCWYNCVWWVSLIHGYFRSSVYSLFHFPKCFLEMLWKN